MFFAKKSQHSGFCNRREKCKFFFLNYSILNFLIFCLIFAKFAPRVHRKLLLKRNILPIHKLLWIITRSAQQSTLKQLLDNLFQPAVLKYLREASTNKRIKAWMEFLACGQAGAPPMSHLSYTTRDACVLMQLSSLLGGMKNLKKNKNFSCQSQLWGWFSHSRLQMRGKNKGKQAPWYLWINFWCWKGSKETGVWYQAEINIPTFLWWVWVKNRTLYTPCSRPNVVWSSQLQ